MFFSLYFFTVYVEELNGIKMLDHCQGGCLLSSTFVCWYQEVSEVSW